MGVKIRYNTPVQALGLDNGEFVAALAGEEDRRQNLRPRRRRILNLTASGCVKHGDRMSAVNGQPITFSSAAPASIRACCSSL